MTLKEASSFVSALGTISVPAEAVEDRVKLGSPLHKYELSLLNTIYFQATWLV